mmetsp:Transcript_125986/g.306103  ORF Transcript_125986/g.306103 Transcript_125986/m.306103 type:complete len:500 (-) Transcript_125986:46-1545(-)
MNVCRAVACIWALSIFGILCTLLEWPSSSDITALIGNQLQWRFPGSRVPGSRVHRQPTGMTPPAATSLLCQICAFLDLNKMAGEFDPDAIAASDYLILTVSDTDLMTSTYRSSSLAWGCFGNRHGVPVRAVDPKHVPSCHRYPSHYRGMWFFDRVCVVALLVASLQAVDKDGGSVGARALSLGREPRWIINFDGDTVPFNADIDLHELSNSWQNRSVILYERFRSGEIVAGNYALQVTSQAAAFMSGWAELHRLGDFFYSNWDNGAIHVQLIRHLYAELSHPFGDGEATVKYHVEIWRQSRGMSAYDRFLAAAKLALGPKRMFRDVLIQRRGQGFCIDNDMYEGKADLYTHSEGIASRYLCIHGAKRRELLVQSVGEACVAAVEQCKSSLMSCSGKQQPHIPDLVSLVRKMAPLRLPLGQQNDVGDCWPDCPVDIPDEQWRQLKKGLTLNAQCSPYKLVGRSFEVCCCPADETTTPSPPTSSSPAQAEPLAPNTTTLVP